MAISPRLNRYPKRNLSLQIENQIPKNKKKVRKTLIQSQENSGSVSEQIPKKKTLIESQENTGSVSEQIPKNKKKVKKTLIESQENPDPVSEEIPKNKKKVKKTLTEPQENSGLGSEQILIHSSTTTCAPPRKRSKDPGVRVIGGRIYSEHGKTCHQCRQKTMDFVAECKGQKKNKPCTLKFCHKCLLNRYGEEAEKVNKLEDWACPTCRGICNCSFCMKKRGHQPTGILVHTAKATGFRSVSDMLDVHGTGKESFSDENDDSIPDSKSIASPSKGKHIKKNKRKILEDSNTNENMIEESKGEGTQSNKRTKEAYLSTAENGEEKTGGMVDGVEKSHKTRENKLKKCSYPKSGVNNRKGTKGALAVSEKNSTSVKTTSKSTEDEEEKINEMDDVEQKKPKKSQGHKKTTLDRVKIHRNGVKDNLEDKPKPDVDIPLPQGIDLTTVSDIELPAKDVGPALQFLEFCYAFQEVLELKKGEPDSVLRELILGRSRRRRQYSSVVRFHVHLLSLIQKDMGEDPSSKESSWLQALGKCISESQCEFKELPSEFFDRCGDEYKNLDDEYENLDSSKRLRLLNFICDEALCTKDLRGWIDKQKEISVQRGREAKEKVHAAKDKERHLKLQMQDEIAKGILLNNGAPLSVSEHEDLVSRIKAEATKAHAEKLEAIGMLPKNEERSDAVRTEPVLLNENGLILWKLQSYSAEPNILLQDIGRMDSDVTEDKWFTYDAEQQKEVENYISFQRKKRLDSVLPNCIKSKENDHKQ
ncbi:Cell division cycle-associated 7-like protein [Thalictrum thalictroides]|uniref:Cell division cycle-associated 7-like protein n=1 Tax=Thalictrum thalictroides TaxID=46969 RepID=A0A7J6V9G2_THATH|nr:Cell division cycle-associated 7-like protein [Thalictrum thalictroides]